MFQWSAPCYVAMYNSDYSCYFKICDFQRDQNTKYRGRPAVLEPSEGVPIFTEGSPKSCWKWGRGVPKILWHRAVQIILSRDRPPAKTIVDSCALHKMLLVVFFYHRAFLLLPQLSYSTIIGCSRASRSVYVYACIAHVSCFQFRLRTYVYGAMHAMLNAPITDFKPGSLAFKNTAWNK